VTANRAAKDQFFGTFGDQNELDDPLTVELQLPSGERLLPDELAAEQADEDPGGKPQGPHEPHDRGLLLRCADGTIVPVRVHATPFRTEEQRGTVLVLDRASQAPDDTAARTEWATAIAHDLRQPINSIMLTSDLLLQGDMAEDQRQHLLRVRSSAKRLSRMVGDMAKLAGQVSPH
jgi:signal transduction histidine kinase